MKQALSSMTAGKIWPEAMSTSFTVLGLPPEDFPRPGGLVEQQVCGATAMRPGEPACRNDLFFEGQAPQVTPTAAPTGQPTPGPEATQAPEPTPASEPTQPPAQTAAPAAQPTAAPAKPTSPPVPTAAPPAKPTAPPTPAATVPPRRSTEPTCRRADIAPSPALRAGSPSGRGGNRTR